MKLAICSEIFINWEVENIISYCANLGYDGLEISAPTLGERPDNMPLKRRDAIRNFAENHKIEIVGLHHVLSAAPGLFISSPDPKIRTYVTEYLIDMIDCCADLGGQKMIFDSPAQRNIGAQQTFQEVWNYTREIFSQCLEHAEAKNITICIEPMSPVETNFINSAAQAIKLIKELNHPNFQLQLDVKALCFEKKPVSEMIFESGQYLQHVHVNDLHGHEPGCGNMDFQPILDTLRKIKYQNYLSVEVSELSDDGETIASRAYHYLSKLL